MQNIFFLHLSIFLPLFLKSERLLLLLLPCSNNLKAPHILPSPSPCHPPVFDSILCGVSTDSDHWLLISATLKSQDREQDSSLFMSVCMCVCVRERKRASARKRGRVFCFNAIKLSKISLLKLSKTTLKRSSHVYLRLCVCGLIVIQSLQSKESEFMFRHLS